MRDEPFGLLDDWDFFDFLEHVHETFLVCIEQEQALLCENLGEFVQLVYQEIQASRSLLNNQDAMHARMIDQMNSASTDQRRSEFELEDLDVKYETVLKDRAKMNQWTELGYSVQFVLGSDIVQIHMKVWSKVLAWILFLALLAGMVFVGVNYRFIVTALLSVTGLIAFARLVDSLPCCVSKPGITLREILNHRIDRLRNQQMTMSLVEVELSIQDAFASWAGAKDPDVVNRNTPFPR